jgi:hypothetical protein
MALIKGKQLQDTSVSLTKLSGATGSVTLTTGTITTPAANLTISSLPVSGSQVANKEYVDSVATGLDIKKSVVAVYRPSTMSGGGTPGIAVVNEANGSGIDDQDLYTLITGGSIINQLIFDGVTISEGDRVLIAATLASRIKTNGIFVYQGGMLLRAEDADNVTPNTGEVSGGMFTFVEQGTVYSDTGWVLSSPNGAISNTGASGLWNSVTNPTGNAQLEFTQFSAAGVAEAGVGLTRTGTKFNVNYDDSSIGIDANDALYVKANGITNAMILNEFITFAGDSGSSNIALGGTLTIAGGTNGIDTAYSTGTLTINLDLSELSTVTTIADSDFIAGVTANGATNQKITFANLKTLIGAASQLAIGVEGGAAASFDLDTDTLNFAAGDGLTFTKSASTAGTTDTLTVTLDLNGIVEDTFTSFSAAANATVTKTLSFATSQILQVNINGVVLKSTQYSISGTTLTILANAIPYVIETTDELSVRYIKQS